MLAKFTARTTQVSVRRAWGRRRRDDAPGDRAILPDGEPHDQRCRHAVGLGLALAGNVWMVDHVAMHRLPLEYFIAGLAAMLALGQLAVLWPALRAASVPPAVATRMI
ncbi:MAG: ABC transporter permease [Rhodanobacteraceae bacterium]